MAIVFFRFFYTALVFNSKETADNLKKSGAFVPGIRPGDQTARYIDRILTRLTLAILDYDAVLSIDPKQASSLYGRGIAKLRSGNKAGSDSDIAAAKVLNPTIAEDFVSYGVR